MRASRQQEDRIKKKKFIPCTHVIVIHAHGYDRLESLDVPFTTASQVSSLHRAPSGVLVTAP